MFEDLRWVANLSLLFTERSLLERPAAAQEAGFTEVEFWWPFGSTGRPSDLEVDRFVRAVDDAGVTLTAMNLFAGDMPAGERGVLSYPERVAEFRDSVDVAMNIARRLGTRMFNAPYGHRREGLAPADQDAVADESLGYAAAQVAEVGGTVMFEPVSGMPRYPMKSSADAFAIIQRVSRRTGANNLGFLLDQFHIAMNGGDPEADARKLGPAIHHVQLADTPGRGEPGSGDGRIESFIATALEAGYLGAFALEFIPPTSTEASLQAWRRWRERL